MSAIKIVRQSFPEAKSAFFCGECDNCHSESLIFFQLPIDLGKPLEGGFYCPDCKFSNAGRLAIDFDHDETAPSRYNTEQEKWRDGDDNFTRY